MTFWGSEWRELQFKAEIKFALTHSFASIECPEWNSMKCSSVCARTCNGVLVDVSYLPESSVVISIPEHFSSSSPDAHSSEERCESKGVDVDVDQR